MKEFRLILSVQSVPLFSHLRLTNVNYIMEQLPALQVIYVLKFMKLTFNIFKIKLNEPLKKMWVGIGKVSMRFQVLIVENSDYRGQKIELLKLL